ncbi:MAG: NFYB/HAP3 family transcription factor subunit [Theionarchaea archaeon]|nr:MAG: histone [Theionarchaea archaeon DG-70-1]MBU7027697.1 NFYB/HAP3 family transcription factor subunit [Theionarchaea archaeon]
MMTLSHRPIDRIMRKAGAERVSEAAAKALAAILEEEAIEISKMAVEYAQHAGRKTVKAEDIKLALR